MLYVILVNFAMFLNSQPSLSPSQYELPATWNSDFIISVSFSGSMSGDSYELKFEHDFCTYTRTSIRSASNNFTVQLTLNESDRNQILSTLRTLNVEKIVKPTDDSMMEPAQDGHSRSLCIGKTCLSGGTGSSLKDESKDIFLSACNFLEEFANEKYTKRK